VKFFTGLRPAERLLVSVMAGPVSPYTVRTVDGEPEIASSCPAGGESAAPAVRLKEFSDAFGARGDFSSLCSGDLAPAMGRLGHAIVQQLGARCAAKAPVRLADGTPDCSLTESAAGLGPDVSMPRCPTAPATAASPAAAGERPCWTLTASPERCPASGYELRIDRGESAPLAGSVATLRCRICTGEKDPRCR
jgi:hypothetical protein